MAVTGPAPIFSAITHRVILARLVDDLLDLHWHLDYLLDCRVDIDSIGSVVARVVDGAHC